MGITVISDFDGTIAEGDFPIILLNNYCKLDWKELDREFKEGKMTLRELIDTEVRNLDIDKAGLADFAQKTIRFRSGFWEFFGMLKGKNLSLIIVSEGLKEYIDPFFETGVEIYANECVEEEDGSLSLSTPHQSEECGKCGNCKKDIVQSFKDKGEFVMYIGDGESDYCAAPLADLRFARARLAEHFIENHIEFIQFIDFNDIYDMCGRMF
jgi:2,3-diketo-5-methylthio-1-phosphopentane phosphatase